MWDDPIHEELESHMWKMKQMFIQIQMRFQYSIQRLRGRFVSKETDYLYCEAGKQLPIHALDWDNK